MCAGALCSENEVKTWGPFYAPNSLKFRRDFIPAGPRCCGFVLRPLPALDSPSDCPAKAVGSCTVTILHFTPRRDNSRTVPRTPQLAIRYPSTLAALRQYTTFSWRVSASQTGLPAYVFRFFLSLLPFAPTSPHLATTSSALPRISFVKAKHAYPPTACLPAAVHQLQGACP